MKSEDGKGGSGAAPGGTKKVGENTVEQMKLLERGVMAVVNEVGRELKGFALVAVFDDFSLSTGFGGAMETPEEAAKILTVLGRSGPDALRLCFERFTTDVKAGTGTTTVVSVPLPTPKAQA